MAIEDWARGHWEEGGGDAFVAFWVFGDLTGELAVSGEKHRVTGMPEGLAIGRQTRGTPDGDEAFATFTDPNVGVIGRILDEDPELARKVRGAKSVMRVVGDVEDPDDLLYLRSTIGIVQAMLEAGAVGVVDSAMHWWSAERWASEVFAPDTPSIMAHVAILGSQDEQSAGKLWLHTRGMRLFGRPDLSVRGVTEATQQAATDLVVRLVNMQALGGIVPDRQPVKMKGIPAGWTCRHAGDIEDPDFNNVHLAIGPG
jgi:hypothetical protein